MSNKFIIGTGNPDSKLIALHVDTLSNIYALISYRGEINLNNTLFKSNTMGVLLIKYNLEILWIMEIGHFIDINPRRNFKITGDDHTNGKIIIDHTDNIHILIRFSVAFKLINIKISNIKSEAGLCYLKILPSAKILNHKYIFGQCNKNIQLLVKNNDAFIFGSHNNNKIWFDNYDLDSNKNLFIAKLNSNSIFEWIKDIQLENSDSSIQIFDASSNNHFFYIIGAFTGKIYFDNETINDNILDLPSHFLKYFLAILDHNGKWIKVRIPQWSNNIQYEYPQSLSLHQDKLYITTYSIDKNTKFLDDDNNTKCPTPIQLLLITLDLSLQDIDIKKINFNLNINYIFDLSPIIHVNDLGINILAYFTDKITIQDIHITGYNNIIDLAFIKINNNQLESIKVFSGFNPDHPLFISCSNNITIISGTINGIFKSYTHTIQTLSNQFLVFYI